MTLINQPTVVYDPAMNYDGGRGGLRIYHPQEKGVINYNLVHTVVEEKNADIWRMTVANEVDRQGNILRQLTKNGAEWEMAVRLRERPDFIGGYAHGDERGTALKLTVDGKDFAPEALTEPVTFQELKLHVSSIGYDPKAQSHAVFEHDKCFCFTENPVDLRQEIRWLEDCPLDLKFKSFLAMMPPLKHEIEHPEKAVTDTFYTDQIPKKAIESLPVSLGETHRFCVSGTDSRLRFTMEAEGYEPRYQNSYQGLLSDNGHNRNYHKMYIAFAGASEETVTKGTVWTSTTRYQIDMT